MTGIPTATRTWTSRVSAKGQVTLPKTVRDELGIAPGGEVSFEALPTGVVVVRPRHGDARALGGLLSRYAPPEPVTTEQMNEAIAQAAAERHAPSLLGAPSGSTPDGSIPDDKNHD